MSPAKDLRFAVALHEHFLHGSSAGVRDELEGLGIPQQRHVRKLQRGTHAEHFRVGLGMNQARKPVAGLAADASAVRHVLFVEHDAAGRRKGMKTGGFQIVEELLDARLMGDGRIRIRRARRRFGRVHTAQAVHLIHLLGLRVERLHVLVADGPGRRDPVVVAQLAEVLPAQTVQGCAVHLRGAADEVVDLRLECPPVGVVPGVRRDVAVVDEDGLRVPVQRFPFQPVAALENQDALPGRRQLSEPACRRLRRCR